MIRQLGLNLVELAIVVAILSITAAVAIPNLASTHSSTLDLSAEEFAQAIRFARSESLRTGNPHGFFLQVANKRIRVFRADMGTNPPTPVYDIYHPVSKQPYDVDLDTHSFAEAASIQTSSSYEFTCNDERYTIFEAQGVPYCGDPIDVLLRDGAITFSLAGDTRKTTLYGLTGRVTVQ